jgi:7,8-dihydropterin-6-yl-methyl-4-(beta-D-ribofuranosyl)aminobenzene 5'-phosphate synthase
MTGRAPVRRTPPADEHPMPGIAMTTLDGPPCPCLSVRLTVLVENTSRRPDAQAEHGFAAYLETERGVILFDTGATGEALAANARALGADLGRVTAIVLSHGHYDHTGGLASALARAPEARVYFHWGATAKRWAKRFGIRKSIGMPDESRRALDQAHRQPVAGPVVLPEGVLVSGPIAGPPAAAQRGFLVTSDSGLRADDFADELFLLARTHSGWILVTGCCHRGLANTLAHALSLTGGEPIAVLCGGLHMRGVRASAVDALVPVLQRAGVRTILTGHCTGAKAAARLVHNADLDIRPLHVGLIADW